MFICGGVVYLGLHYTTATNATLIYACSPVMILILEWLFRGRPIGLLEIAGAALAFAGVAVVALGASGNRFAPNPGDAMMALGALSWADLLGACRAARASPPFPAFPSSPRSHSPAQCCSAPMMLFEAARGPAFPRSADTWLAVAAIALVPSVGAFAGYQYGIRRFGPGDDWNGSLYADALWRGAGAALPRRAPPHLSPHGICPDRTRGHPGDDPPRLSRFARQPG